MAGNGQQDVIEQIRARILAQAYDKAAKVLTAKTGLSEETASKVAPDVVDAATADIRREHSQQLAAISGEEATALGFASLVVLVLDLAVMGTVAVRGPRWTRPLAGAAMIAHAGMFAYSKRATSRIRAAARVETARGGAGARGGVR